MKEEYERESYSDEELIYWLALQDKSNLLPTEKAVRIFRQFGSMKALWEISNLYHRRFEMDDYKIRNLSKYVQRVDFSDLGRMLRTLRANDYRIIRYVDKEYPRMLKDAKNPPLFILHKGSLLNFDHCVAVAGTRNASSYGLTMARKIGKFLASNGYTVVSGLARGIDEWAHCGALEASGGRTIAVLAWMDPIYPSEHSKLANDIIRRGALISERFMNPQDRSAPSKFVQRNHITSGISECVIAIESGEEGGTVHQVGIALEQGKKVFALKPKTTDDGAKKGFKSFVEMGAIPIEYSRGFKQRLQRDLPPIRERKLDSFSERSIDRFLKE